MPDWLTWLLIAVLAWILVSIPATLYLGRLLRLAERGDKAGGGDAPTETVLRAAVPALAASFAHRSRPSSPRRILIVDDDASLRMLLRTTLTADEFEVAEAEDAERAAELARFWRPTVVLLDVAMPGIDGLSFCSELKRKPAFTTRRRPPDGHRAGGR